MTLLTFLDGLTVRDFAMRVPSPPAQASLV